MKKISVTRQNGELCSDGRRKISVHCQASSKTEEIYVQGLAASVFLRLFEWKMMRLNTKVRIPYLESIIYQIRNRTKRFNF